MKKLIIIIGVAGECFVNACAMERLQSRHDMASRYSMKWSLSSKTEDSAEKLLEDCKKEVEGNNFDKATGLFKRSVNAPGDQACFFFGNVVRWLIKHEKLTLKADLYTDGGITDETKQALNNLQNKIIEEALTACYRKRQTNVAE